MNVTCDSQVGGHEESMAAASARSLTFDDDQPLRWFLQFEKRMTDLLDIRLKEQDAKIEGVRFDLDQMTGKIKHLEDVNRELAEKLDDLENRSRRTNVILHGVPESETPNENCFKLVTDLFAKFVGVEEAQVKAAIQRVHCTPTGRPQNKDKPRIIHVNFATFQDKICLFKACVAKFKNSTFMGRKLFISDDLSKGIQARRRAKMEIFKRLQREGKRPFFVFPDIIKFREGQTLVTV